MASPCPAALSDAEGEAEAPIDLEAAPSTRVQTASELRQLRREPDVLIELAKEFRVEGVEKIEIIDAGIDPIPA